MPRGAVAPIACLAAIWMATTAVGVAVMFGLLAAARAWGLPDNFASLAGLAGSWALGYGVSAGCLVYAANSALKRAGDAERARAAARAAALLQ